MEVLPGKRREAGIIQDEAQTQALLGFQGVQAARQHLADDRGQESVRQELPELDQTAPRNLLLQIAQEGEDGGPIQRRALWVAHPPGRGSIHLDEDLSLSPFASPDQEVGVDHAGMPRASSRIRAALSRAAWPSTPRS